MVDGEWNALSPICHHDFGFHDAQKENYERRRDGVLVEKDCVLVMRWWRRIVSEFSCLFFTPPLVFYF